MFIEYTYYRTSEDDIIMLTDTRLDHALYAIVNEDNPTVVPAREEDCLYYLVAVADNMDELSWFSIDMDEYKKFHADRDNHKVMAYLMMGTGTIY
ncbi:MAG: hypothetical protein IKO45_04960 [Clostridia bacterium]|nr:hypothetical protein [Clostridia bacterium]MBR4623884.1 hypothetical protein [Clostridia bacterium]